MSTLLHQIAVASLVSGGLVAVVVAVDLFRRPQHMWIMNVVWPVTMLWSGWLGLAAYLAFGRAPARGGGGMPAGGMRGMHGGGPKKPFWQSVAVGATHCGAGCSLADLIVEWVLLAVPLTLFGSHVFATWAVDFVVAFVVGIAFQYFAIAPMRGLGLRDGLLAALKADALSLSAWQVGMYGWMAIALFALSSPQRLPVRGVGFWFMMQLGMAAGFLTSYPVNWWLIRSGVKEAM